MKNYANRAPWIEVFAADTELCTLLNYSYKNIKTSADVFNKNLSWEDRFNDFISSVQDYSAYQIFFDAIDTDHYYYFKFVGKSEVEPPASNRVRSYLKRWLITMIVYDELIEKLKVDPAISNYKLWMAVGNITSLTIGFEGPKAKAYIISDFDAYKVATPFIEHDNVYVSLQSEKAKPKTQSAAMPARKLYPVVIDWFKSLKG